MLSYADACRDPNLFGPWFDGESWARWRVLDRAIFGEELTETELKVFAELTGRTTAPSEPAKEAWLVMGRRSGKDVKAASLCAYLATVGVEVRGLRKHLVPGERGVVQFLAVDKDQSQIAMNYLKAFFEQPLLQKLVKRITADSVELTNRISIEVATNDTRRVRGRTTIAAVLDEVAHWKSEDSANPDIDVFRGLQPGMATIPGALVIGISSPYARRGLLYTKFKEHYGKDGPVLVAKAPTWVMNPTLPRDGEVIRSAYDQDESWANAEFGAEFRSDIETFLSREAIEACIDTGVTERPPDRRNHYIGFCDPAGGSGDAMALAIAHPEGKHVVVDLIREYRPPFSPEAASTAFADLLRQYSVGTVIGDAFGAQWAAETMGRHGFYYHVSERPKARLYEDFLAITNSRLVVLPDHKRMVNQLAGLERKTTRSGRDSIDHAPGGHDDLANVVAGSASYAAKGTTTFYKAIREQESRERYRPGTLGVLAGEAFGLPGFRDTKGGEPGRIKL